MSVRRVLTQVASKLRRGRDRHGQRAGTRSGTGIRIAYTPDHDGHPDPGEVVWAWVPYEDDSRQGKDRPVVVIGSAGDRLAVVPLSSRGPDGRPDPAAWVSVGSGRWDGQGRTSYANVDRILRVTKHDVRREGATLGRARFDAVVAGVRQRHPDVR
jgi:hypothetical protein